MMKRDRSVKGSVLVSIELLLTVVLAYVMCFCNVPLHLDTSCSLWNSMAPRANLPANIVCTGLPLHSLILGYNYISPSSIALQTGKCFRGIVMLIFFVFFLEWLSPGTIGN